MKLAQQGVAFATGAIFAIGLGISGMTQPQKVIGFLDIFGNWDPALMFVMIGAIGFHSLTYQLIMKRSSPILSERFMIPEARQIDARLIIGGALFGIGWGIGGYCPGPALTSLVAGQADTLIFVAAMLTGMGVFQLSQRVSQK